MLILSRKRGESVMVDGPARITLVEVCGGNKVRLGIEAGQGTKIVREELLEREEEEDGAYSFPRC